MRRFRPLRQPAAALPLTAALLAGMLAWLVAGCAPPVAPGTVVQHSRAPAARPAPAVTAAEMEAARTVLRQYLDARARGDLAAQYALLSADSRAQATPGEFAGMRAQGTDTFGYAGIGEPAVDQGYLLFPVTILATDHQPETELYYTMVRDPDGWRVAWADHLVFQASDQYDAGDMTGALTTLQKVLAINPYHPYSHYLVALACMSGSNGCAARAFRSINTAIIYEPEVPDYYRVRGLLHYVERSDLNAARLDYERALELAADDSQGAEWEGYVRMLYAVVLQEQGELVQAREQAAYALWISPGDPELIEMAEAFDLMP